MSFTSMIAGLVSYIYKPATSSHFKLGLFGTTSLTWSSIDFRNLIREDHYLSRLTNWDSLSFPKFAGSWFPEFARFQSSWNRQQTCDPRSIRRLFRTMLEDQRIVQNQQNTFTNISLTRIRFSVMRHIHEYIHEFGNSDVLKVKGFFPNSPNKWSV
jgi:hypothetical protein